MAVTQREPSSAQVGLLKSLNSAYEQAGRLKLGTYDRNIFIADLIKTGADAILQSVIEAKELDPYRAELAVFLYSHASLLYDSAVPFKEDDLARIDLVTNLNKTVRSPKYDPEFFARLRDDAVNKIKALRDRSEECQKFARLINDRNKPVFERMSRS